VSRPTDAFLGGSWFRELVQARSDDVVVAAALFKPNAPGNFDLSPSGFGDRQLLKACCAYLGERIVLGVTPVHVHAVELLFGGRVARTITRWPRDDLSITRVSARRGRHEKRSQSWPAFVVTLRSGRPLAELQAVNFDDDAVSVVDLLGSGRSILTDRKRELIDP
jgi:hypothetical protein